MSEPGKEGMYQCSFCNDWIEPGQDLGPYETVDGDEICQACYEGTQEEEKEVDALNQWGDEYGR